MDKIQERFHELRCRITYTHLNPQQSTKEVPVILKEKGYDVVTNDENGNFCISVQELFCIEGVAVSKVNYKLVLRIAGVTEVFPNIYRYDDFTPLIDILINEGKSLYPQIIEKQKEDKQVALFQTLVDGILSTKELSEKKILQGKEFFLEPSRNGDDFSVIMFTQFLTNLRLGVNLSEYGLEDKTNRLLKVCSTIPDDIYSDRPIRISATFAHNWDNKIKTIKSKGLNKNYDSKANRHFIDNSYSEKSQYPPRAQKLVKFLNKKGIDYGYSDNGDFIIQYAPAGDNYGVICWNDIDFGYTDYHYYITKKGVLKRRSKDSFKGLVEKITEDEFIQLLTLALENNAFHAETDVKILRHSLISSIAGNRLPTGLMVSGPFVKRWDWTGKGFGPKLFIRIPDINVEIFMQWESLKQFIAEHNQIEQLIPVIEALRHIVSQDEEVRLV